MANNEKLITKKLRIYKNDYYLSIFAGVLFGMVCGIMIVILFIAFSTGYNEDYCISIPDSKQVKMFCQDNGFKDGWLDGNCGINKVECYREFGDLTEYKCLEYIK